MSSASHPFAALSSLKKDIAARNAQKAKAEAERLERERLERQRANEFKNAMAGLGVKKIVLAPDTMHHEKPKPLPYPMQKKLDEKAVLTDSLSDNFGIDHLLDSDERTAYHAPSVAPNTPRLLHSGKWSIKASLDLHGYTCDEARPVLAQFLTEQRKAGNRAVRIIHGQGFGSYQKIGILKERVPCWLIQREEVLAFVQAPPYDGGAGALYVLLAP